jgi:hypothetical protein
MTRHGGKSWRRTGEGGEQERKEDERTDESEGRGGCGDVDAEGKEGGRKEGRKEVVSEANMEGARRQAGVWGVDAQRRMRKGEEVEAEVETGMKRGRWKARVDEVGTRKGKGRSKAEEEVEGETRMRMERVM